MKLKRSPRCRAFSLIEITIALGIFAFVLVSMLGLMGASISSERRADFDTVVARMAQNTSAWIRNEGFDVVKSKTAYDSADLGVDFYFESDGSLIRLADGFPDTGLGAASQAAYSGRVTKYDPEMGSSVIGVRMEFVFLKAATPSQQYTWSFLTTLADYD